MIPAVVLGYGLALAVTAPFVPSWAPAPTDWPYLAIMGLVVLPLGVGLVTHRPPLSTGPRGEPALPGRDGAGPLWVWLALAERPRVPALAAPR